MSCFACDHYLPGVFTLAASNPVEKWDTAPDGFGICRRYPPRSVPDLEQQDTLSLFPGVHRDQRCGEFTRVGAEGPLC